MSKAQRSWAERLARGKITQERYLKEIHDQKVDGGGTEYDEDQKIDQILRGYKDPQFGNISEKLDRLIDARESFQPRFLELVSDTRLDGKTFQKELKKLVDQKAQKILSTTAEYQTRLKFGFGGGFLTATGAALTAAAQPFGVAFLASGIPSIMEYFKALANYYKARKGKEGELGLMKIDLGRRFRGDGIL